jgi:hypothetical protein
MSESDRKPRYQTRLPADDAERVDEYVETNGISQAEGVRRLIRAGLKAESQNDEPEGQLQRARLGPLLPLLVALVFLVLLFQVLVFAGVTL